ncbi:hypothetical protein NP493_799g00035 [Ridgeia piscesae]|uniref:Plastocyanin-like domain-containing protein n=1 Tax=Ridgeia piscesae TaxID=27915 RepID=A0AAD9KMT2_RIDPI|nr:hypothetical protein NP493_799g00035 [Ridgeia piscesae]
MLVFRLLLVTAAVVMADICRDPVCEFTFVIRRTSSMTYRGSSGTLYNVALNGTRLQQDDDAAVGYFINPSDVITLDGFTRDLIVVNDIFPGPTIEVMEGAQVVVRVINDLLTEGITLHWHGMHVINTPWMDGTAYVTQCPVPAQHSFTYRFTAFPHGTHW